MRTEENKDVWEENEIWEVTLHTAMKEQTHKHTHLQGKKNIEEDRIIIRKMRETRKIKMHGKGTRSGKQPYKLVMYRMSTLASAEHLHNFSHPHPHL